MYSQRKHFHRFRRYTYNEPTCWFDDGYIYIEGSNLDDIESIYITGNIDPEGYANGEEDVTIPGWMIPDIKKAIMTNELAFMLKRPSDDSNNSTLSSVKPNGPQDKENKKATQQLIYIETTLKRTTQSLITRDISALQTNLIKLSRKRFQSAHSPLKCLMAQVLYVQLSISLRVIQISRCLQIISQVKKKVREYIIE